MCVCVCVRACAQREGGEFLREEAQDVGNREMRENKRGEIFTIDS